MLVLGGCAIPAPKQEQSLKGADFNQVETVTSGQATTTNSALPIIVLNHNASRKYAKIINDSATAIYLYLGNFASASAASTTVGVNKGIRLNATGGEYVIGPDNLWQGECWASSTASGLNISYSEMQ